MKHPAIWLALVAGLSVLAQHTARGSYASIVLPERGDRFLTFNADKNTFSWNGRDGKYYTIDFNKRTMSNGTETKFFSAAEQARMTFFFQGLLVSYANESEDWFPDPDRYHLEHEGRAPEQMKGSN